MTTDLAGRIAELAAQIEARLTEDAAGSWSVHDVATCDALLYEEDMAAAAADTPECDCGYPARVLRCVKATRELVAVILAEPHDPARNPAGHQRVARLLTIIATEWEEK